MQAFEEIGEIPPAGGGAVGVRDGKVPLIRVAGADVRRVVSEVRHHRRVAAGGVGDVLHVVRVLLYAVSDRRVEAARLNGDILSRVDVAHGNRGVQLVLILSGLDWVVEKQLLLGLVLAWRRRVLQRLELVVFLLLFVGEGNAVLLLFLQRVKIVGQALPIGGVPSPSVDAVHISYPLRGRLLVVVVNELLLLFRRERVPPGRDRLGVLSIRRHGKRAVQNFAEALVARFDLAEGDLVERIGIRLVGGHSLLHGVVDLVRALLQRGLAGRDDVRQNCGTHRASP